MLPDTIRKTTAPRNSAAKSTFSWFFRPREVWFPTIAGWVLIVTTLSLPIICWVLWGEGFLRATQREHATVLVVEGWIGDEALEAAAREFKAGGYNLVVTTGGPNGENWHRKRWTYAEIGHDRLVVYGVPHDRILRADAPDVPAQRTHTAAVCAKQALYRASATSTSLNVFTLGSHARRSQAVYAKAFAPAVKVGIISWLPPSSVTTPWWRSTTRAKAMLTETIGYLYETLLDSGRPGGAPTDEKPS